MFITFYYIAGKGKHKSIAQAFHFAYGRALSLPIFARLSLAAMVILYAKAEARLRRLRLSK